MRRHPRRAPLHLGLALLLLAIALAPFALAQKPPGPKPTGAGSAASAPKKGGKPAASASASASASAAPAAEPSASAEPAPAASASAPAASASATPTEPPVAAPKEDSSDVTETDGKKYYFIGLRYRGNVIPKFMLNLFVAEGATIYSNTLGVELDMRKDGFSIIPALSYTEYGTGDILFMEKGKDATLAGNYSFVNSGLKSLYVTADLLWSTKISKNFDFEYGAGFGLGVIFGDLSNNWVYENPAGPLAASNGRHYAPCPSEGFAAGCNKADHQNASVAKVGNYTEPSWVNGGSKPNVFPWIGVPQLGLRFKPVKQFEARLGLGFALTGFWFGLSGNYGLETPEKAPAKKTGGLPELRFH